MGVPVSAGWALLQFTGPAKREILTFTKGAFAPARVRGLARGCFVRFPSLGISAFAFGINSGFSWQGLPETPHRVWRFSCAEESIGVCSKSYIGGEQIECSVSNRDQEFENRLDAGGKNER